MGMRVGAQGRGLDERRVIENTDSGELKSPKAHSSGGNRKTSRRKFFRFFLLLAALAGAS